MSLLRLDHKGKTAYFSLFLETFALETQKSRCEEALTACGGPEYADLADRSTEIQDVGIHP